MRHARLISEFNSMPWAILPATLQAMQMILHRWASGIRLSQDEIRSAVGDSPNLRAARRDREGSAGGSMIGVLPVYGVIGHRASLVQDSSSGVNTSTELLGKTFRKLMADDQVGAIVLDVDSPGGSVYGVEELAAEIAAARGKKRIVASVNSQAASAAYWIASAADEIVITPGGEAGSIGVWAAHVDASQYYQDQGLQFSLVSAGKYKVEGNSYGPLGEEARAFMQSRVEEYYGAFVKGVARNRRDTETRVRDGYGEGRVLGAEAAVKANLADRIGTFDQVITELWGKTSRKSASPSSSRSWAPASSKPQTAKASGSNGVALAKARIAIAEAS